MADPLILTLTLDAETTARVEALRRAHFPPDRNVVPAHVTLFHHLPGDRADAVMLRVAEVARTTPPLAVRVGSVMPLGRKGSALLLSAPHLEGVRRDVARGFDLVPQDQGRKRPHVTVQNKVDPDTAARTLDALRAEFAPWDAAARGLTLWWYRGGPWEEAGQWDFAGRPAG